MRIFIATMAVLAAGFLPASAADTYSRQQSVKDSAVDVITVVDANRSGIYITGELGYASIDRSVRRDISRQIDLRADVTGEDPQDIADAQADLDAAGIANRLDGNNLFIPLIADRLGLSGGDEPSAATFGGEVSYLWHTGRLGFEIGIAGTFYGDNDTKLAHNGAVGSYTGGTLFSHPDICNTTCAGDASHFPQSGGLSFERDFDIDLPLKVHGFVNDRLSVFVGAGPSFAFATLKGHSSDDTLSAMGRSDLSTSHDEDVTSFGYVLTAGFQYWATDRITIGGAYTYKAHDFDSKESGSGLENLGPGVDLVGQSRDSIEIEDEIHTFKARIGFKLN